MQRIVNRETFNVDNIDPTDGNWLAGLIDGEGCFTMRRIRNVYQVVFTISLRDDETVLLDTFAHILGIEKPHTVRDDKSHMDSPNCHPTIKLSIYDAPTLHYRLNALLKRYPLRSKKKFEFRVFDLAITILINKRLEGRRNAQYTTEELDQLERCAIALHNLKKYKADYANILENLSLSTN